MITHRMPAMNKWKVFLVCLLLSSYAIARSAATSSVHFINKDIGAALSLAKKLHKPVFVDAYTTWCAPCHELKRQTFRDKRIAARFNTHYINIAVDVEKGTGVKFAEQYEVDSYPTLLFINEEGKVIKKIEGFVDAKPLEAIAAGIK